ALRRRLGVGPVHQSDRGERARDEAGDSLAHRTSGEVSGGGAEQLERKAHALTGLGRRTRGVPPTTLHSSTGHRRRRATRSMAASGETATGFPTARKRGRSEWLSAYA